MSAVSIKAHISDVKWTLAVSFLATIEPIVDTNRINIKMAKVSFGVTRRAKRAETRLLIGRMLRRAGASRCNWQAVGKGPAIDETCEAGRHPRPRRLQAGSDNEANHEYSKDHEQPAERTRSPRRRASPRCMLRSSPQHRNAAAGSKDTVHVVPTSRFPKSAAASIASGVISIAILVPEAVGPRFTGGREERRGPRLGRAD